MAWSIVGVGSVVETTGTTLTLTEPAGVANGDLLIACISLRSTATTGITCPNWALAGQKYTNNVLTTTSAVSSACMLYRVRSGTPSLSFTIPAGVSVVMGRIIAYRTDTGTAAFDASTNGSTAINTTAVSLTGLTTNVTNTLVVALAAGGQEATWSNFRATTPATGSGATDTTTAPSTTTWAERADSISTAGAQTSLGIFDAVKSTAGVTGNTLVTASLGASHTVIVSSFKAVVAGTADAWNTNDKSSSITLANVDKKATIASATASGVRSSTLHLNGDTGAFYAEFVIDDALSGSNPSVGIRSTSGVPGTSSAPYVTVAGNNGNILLNGSATGSTFGVAFATGDVLCIAWNSGTERIWFRLNGGNWNNDGSANPATSTNGIDISVAEGLYLGLYFQGAIASRAVTIRTEAAEYTQTPPSGFTSWMGEALAGGGVTATVTGNSVTVGIDPVTVATVASVSTTLTDQQIAVSTNDVTAIGRIPVAAPVTTNLATVAVDQVTISAKANASTTTNLATVSLDGVTIVGKANISTTGLQSAVSVGDVTVSTTSRVDVSTTLTGQQIAISTNDVTAIGKAIVQVTTNLATTAVGTVTASLPKQVLVTTNLASVSVGDVTATGKANVSVSGLAVTPAVGTISATPGTGVSTTLATNLATTSVGTPTLIGKANVLLSGHDVTLSASGVSVSAGGSVATSLTGQEIAAAVGDVTVVVAKRSVSSSLAGQAVAVSVEPVSIDTPGPATIFVGLTDGAALGVIGSGGSLPTGWQGDFSRCTVEIVRIGVDDSVEAFDVTVTTDGSIDPDEDTYFNIRYPYGGIGTAALPGQTWRASAYMKLLSASGPPLIDHTLGVVGIDNSTVRVNQAFDDTAPASGGAFQSSYREIDCLLASEDVVSVYGDIWLEMDETGTPVVFTLRLGAHLEDMTVSDSVAVLLGGQQLTVSVGSVTVPSIGDPLPDAWDLSRISGSIVLSNFDRTATEIGP